MVMMINLYFVFFFSLLFSADQGETVIISDDEQCVYNKKNLFYLDK